MFGKYAPNFGIQLGILLGMGREPLLTLGVIGGAADSQRVPDMIHVQFLVGHQSHPGVNQRHIRWLKMAKAYFKMSRFRSTRCSSC